MDPTTSEEELDLALAAELQAALLPKECPSSCPNQRAAALNRMCGSVGGDFYDFLRLNAEQTVLVVGDVVGHGVRASLLMAKLMGYLRSAPTNLSRPAKMIAELNRMLLDLGERTGSVMPCSMFYAVLDAPTGVGFFVNAGHPLPFLCDTTKCAALHLGSRNMILGVEEFEPQEACHTFAAGERLVLYTDGVLDAANPEGERFQKHRLHELVTQNADQEPEACARAIFEAVESFRAGARQSDDETVVVVDRI
jgi:sigma-B regulation protein RsbU (phosphoserine phosphatase)